MSEKKVFYSQIKSFEKGEEKILYGENRLVCFACGEEIENDTDICPYCKTTIN